MIREKTITANGNSEFLVLPDGECVIEVVCSTWSTSTATLKRIVNDSAYTVQDADGDVVFSENGGIVVPGGACYYLLVANYANPITFKATPF